MLTISPGLTLLSIVFLPLAVALSVGFRKVIHRKFHMQYSRGAVSYTHLDVYKRQLLHRPDGKKYPDRQSIFIPYSLFPGLRSFYP